MFRIELKIGCIKLKIWGIELEIVFFLFFLLFLRLFIKIETLKHLIYLILRKNQVFEIVTLFIFDDLHQTFFLFILRHL